MPFKPPDCFDFKTPEAWPAWRKRFERYSMATELDGKSFAIQLSSLIYAMGPSAEQIYESFNFVEDDNATLKAVLDKFDTHFTPQKNVIHVRAMFHQRSQGSGESIEAFHRALYELSEYANFPERDEAIRDRFVLGVRDIELSEKLQLQADLTLDRAIQMARQFESVKKQMGEQRSQAQVDAVHSSRGRGKQRGGSARGGARGPKRSDFSTASQRDSCGRCGRTQHSREDQCPAKGQKCRKCGKIGHFKIACRSKKTVSNVNAESETYFMGAVSRDGEDPWRETLTIGSQKVNFKLDTGADVSVVSSSTYHSLNPRPSLDETKAILQSPGGRLSCIGTFKANVTTSKDKTGSLTFYVLDGHTENLLSREATARFGFVQRLDEIDTEVFGDVGNVKCKPIKISLTEDAKPYSLHTTRRIPIPLLPKVEEELKRMEKNGVITRVTEPTDWCAPIVPVAKPNGGVRLCTDFKRLNAAVKRERYVLPTLEDITYKLRGSTVFSKLDATSGYWQLPLDEETAKLTTFITPFGRFYYNRLPFGISSASEIFQRTMESILGDIPGVECFQDDVLLHSKTTKDHERLKTEVFQRVKESGLTLNRKKCEFDKDQIEFLGHIVTREGIRPDPSKLEAILQMPDPASVPELRRWLGMVNYLGRFLPDLSQHLAPLNDLLRKDAHWVWEHAQSEAIKRVKHMLMKTPTLAFYDPSKKTTVSADASGYGLGGVLLQEHEGEMKPVAFCSRTLTPAEKGYAQIEKECLAMVWACERFQRFLVGLAHFTTLTDHRPLVSLVNTKDLQETPLRCQRLLMRLLRFNLTAVYAPGKDLVVADTLSRCPLQVSSIGELQEEVEIFVQEVASAWPATDAKLEQIRCETARDVNLKYTMDYVMDGWPEHRQDVKLAAREFFGVRNELSIHDRLLLRGDRIVIPFSMRNEMLERIHDGHQGINKCRERAGQAIWWPGMSKDIEDRVAKCRHCLSKKPSQPSEPLIPSTLPSRPFEKVAVDLCELKGSNYLVLVDYFSRYIDISHVQSITSQAIIGKLKNSFAHHGIPEVLISDNGRQFVSAEFKKFAEDWNFSQITTSPHFPQANGAAERAVKTAKDILRQDDPFLALLAYRSTPIPDLGISPAELAFGRRLRTTLPALPRTLNPSTVDKDKVRARDEAFKGRQKQAFDRRHGVRSLPSLHPGDPVLIKLDGRKEWNQPATVKQVVAPRSYLVQTAGGDLRRNRRHLRPDTTVRSTSPTADQPGQRGDTLGRRDETQGQRGDTLGRRNDTQGQHIDIPGQPIDIPGQHIDAPGQRVNQPGRRPTSQPRDQPAAQELPGQPDPLVYQGLPVQTRVATPQPSQTVQNQVPKQTHKSGTYHTRSGRSVVTPARYC